MNKYIIALMFLFVVSFPNYMWAQEDAQIVVDAQIGSQAGLGYKVPSTEFGLSFENQYKWNETDIRGFYSPDRKVITNDGQSYGASIVDAVWFSHRIGAFGTLRHNTLLTSQFDKGSFDYAPGVVVALGKTDNPVGRVYVDYLIPSGGINKKTFIESSRTQGPEIDWQFGMGRVGRVGIEAESLIGIYHFDEQGDQLCDGTLGGPITCPRATHATYTAMLGLRFVLPVGKHK